MRVRFAKMQGAGNDFVVIDATKEPFALDNAQLKRIADRRFGVGADQILVVEPPARAASSVSCASGASPTSAPSSSTR